MGDDTDPLDRLDFLTRSEARVEILRRLLDGPATQRDLRTALSHSRSTVTRALSALAERDCLEQAGDRYRLTPSGRIVAEGLVDLLDTVRATDELSTFIRWFPYEDCALTVDQLRGAEITPSTEADPYAPSRTHAETLTVAESFGMLLPSIDLQLIEKVHDRVLAGDLELEILLSPGMEETVTSGSFARCCANR